MDNNIIDNNEWLEITHTNSITNKLDLILNNLQFLNTRINNLESQLLKYENTDDKITKMLLENREIFTTVMNKFITLEKEEIKPMLTELTKNQQKIANEPIKNVLEYNRLWRIYSNNFRQNITTNNTNILTQLAFNTNIKTNNNENID